MQVEVYMDEIFHVPQAEAFCRLRFDHYHPAITTFPGLYLLATAAYRLVGLPLGIRLDVQFLRAINVLLAAALLETLMRVRQRLFPSEEPTLPSLVIATFPISFFFYFLFYTDTASTLFVTAAYLVSLPDCRSPSQPKGFTPHLLQFAVILITFFIEYLTWLLYVDVRACGADAADERRVGALHSRGELSADADRHGTPAVINDRLRHN